jgi:hypothetical protein
LVKVVGEVAEAVGEVAEAVGEVVVASDEEEEGAQIVDEAELLLGKKHSNIFRFINDSLKFHLKFRFHVKCTIYINNNYFFH